MRQTRDAGGQLRRPRLLFMPLNLVEGREMEGVEEMEGGRLEHILDRLPVRKLGEYVEMLVVEVGK